MFNGTIRDNLDPCGQKDDRDLWEALEQANLKDFVGGLAEKLNYNVGEGGDSLRFGISCLCFFWGGWVIINYKHAKTEQQK